MCMSCEHTMISLMFVKMPKGKRLRSHRNKQRKMLQMSMTILRNSIGVNGLKDLLNEHLMPQEFTYQDQEATERES